MNSNGLTICTPLTDGDKINCGISGQDVQIAIDALAPRADPIDPKDYSVELSWTMSNIKNAASIRPSGGFAKVRVLDIK
jgi:hypothetical protein